MHLPRILSVAIANSFISSIPSHLSVVLAVSSLFVILLALNPSNLGVRSTSEAHTGPNSAPTAFNDGPHTVHDTMLLPQVMTNDSDPDGDPITFDIIGSEPLHGHLTTGEPPGVIRYTVTTADIAPASTIHSWEDSSAKTRSGLLAVM